MLSRSHSRCLCECFPLGAVCALGSLLVVMGVVSFAVVSYGYGMGTGYNEQVLDAGRKASFIVLISGVALLFLMLLFVLCVKMEAGRRRRHRAASIWHAAVVNRLSETTMHDNFSSVIRTSTAVVTPPPSYEDVSPPLTLPTPPPSYEIAMNQNGVWSNRPLHVDYPTVAVHQLPKSCDVSKP